MPVIGKMVYSYRDRQRATGRMAMKTEAQISTIAMAAACGLAITTAQAQERINVVGYTSVWFDAQKACIVEPFNKATKDVVVVMEPGLSSTTFVKLKQQKA